MINGRLHTIASKIQPNPLEVHYWVDLSEDVYGRVIKVYNGMEWVPIAGGISGEIIDYNKLINKPTINGQTISGNVTLEQIGVDDEYIKKVADPIFIDEQELDDYTYSEKEIDQKIEETIAWKEIS